MTARSPGKHLPTNGLRKLIAYLNWRGARNRGTDHC
jgi:hypothetical protein